MMLVPATLVLQNHAESHDDPSAAAVVAGAEPEANANANEIDAIVLDAPNFDGATLNADKSVKQVKLTQKSQKKNKITDDVAWFDNNQVKLPIIYTVEPYIPRMIPNAFDPKDVDDRYLQYNGIPLMTAYEYGDTQIYTYGDVYYHVVSMLVVRNGEPLRAFDFSNYAQVHEHYIAWAVVEDDILYVQHTGNGHAAGFNGQNAYISAISLADNKALWTSKPLTANARNFIISGNSLICGYGFSDEPDFLYVLDKKSGERVQSLKLKTGPDFIIEKDGVILVRTYSEDYVFSMK